MKDADGQVIYVGKANNLRSRVRSYFHDSANHSRKVENLVRHIMAIEWIVVGSELEALILEMNLIKRYRPKYNVRLKDDKYYPYIKVLWGEDFPKVFVTRKMIDDGSRYFGPYTSAWAVHQTLDILRKVFPFLTCDRIITGQDARACLYYDIKLCLGPCIGAIAREDYRQMIKDLMRFLNGDTDPIAARLQREMAKAAVELKYELAASFRDQITAIERVVEGQKVISRDRYDSDIIAFARDDDAACVQVFFVRKGKLIGRDYFILEGTRAAHDAELVQAFIKQFYAASSHIPDKLLLPVQIEEMQIIETWLNKKRGGKVEIRIPQRGVKKELLQLAAENAAETLQGLRSSWEADHQKHIQAMAELQEVLDLKSPPVRIECYDISNLQGTATAGSMVVFERGVPNKKNYRNFSIKTVDGQDDFACMEEVLLRRFKRWQNTQAEDKTPGKKLDQAFGILPDLLIVDGGKGQLSRAVKILAQFGIDEKVPVVGLAKRNEELFVPGKSDPLILPRRSQALFLVQRVRDEAHRFAVRLHRTRRRKIGLASQLDAIPGVGPKRRKALLAAFGDVKGIRKAREDEIAAVSGISAGLARTIKSNI